MTRIGERSLILLALLIATLLIAAPVAAATTQLHIVKYANDGTTVISETTKTYQWLETNLPVLGDGVTHYYHQGPVFIDDPDEATEQALRWNPDEDTNVEEKDQGAVKGTNLKDICDLVGGMNAGETVKLKASDGFTKTFAYDNVYNYPDRQGPMVITWYQNGNYPDGSYTDGMKLVFFADDSVNPWGIHAMGNYDWHESAAEEYWYYYVSGSEKYPTTTGLSVKYISDVLIYSDDEVPVVEAPVAAFTATPLSGTEPLTVTFTDQSTGTGPLSYAWDFNNDGTVDSTDQNPSFIFTSEGTYSVNLTVTNTDGSDSEIKDGYITVSSASVIDTLFDGTVTLAEDETFTVTAYNNASGIYTISRTTPLGALDKVASQQGFSYNVTDKRWSYDQVLLLDDVGQYLRKKPGYWYAYVNDVYKDGYGNNAAGLNVIELADNDRVVFYYASGVTDATNLADVISKATAAVKITADIQAAGPVADVLFDGTATLTTGETFTVQAYNNATGTYTVSRTTPLGALDKVASQQGFSYNVTDKRWSYDQVLLLDDVGQYLRKKSGYWYAYVNDVYKDGYGNNAAGLNVIELADNDQVNFYYAPTNDPTNATAVVKIKISLGSTEVQDWTLSLKGAKETTVSQTLFEQGLACSSSGHQVFWTDTDGNVWGGVPLWLLVAMVDDDPDTGSDHFNFNDALATQGYSVKVVSGDGWDTTLASADIARNDSYIVANTLNGEPLLYLLESGKRSWPLHLKGAAVFGGQQVGNITSIELTGLPEPETGWTLTLEGDVTDVITQSYFEEAIACHHNVTWTDSSGNVWEGVSLWDLAGAVDDIETTSHFTFNDTRAAMGYTIRVSAGDGYNATFTSADVAHNDGFFLAYKMNGLPLTDSAAPLKLVGPSTTSGKQRVGNVVRISLEGLPAYPAGDWQLKLDGKISDVIPQPEFVDWAAHHSATYTDSSGNVYTGIPLWRLLGWVDDRIPHGSNGFNDAAAIAGYTVIVKAGDGYEKSFTSQPIGKDDSFIVANTINGGPLPTEGTHPPYPLRLVGSGATGGNSVGNIVEIQLTDFQTPVEAPTVHIVKYDSDRTTVLDEITIDYHYMEENFDVIGDGVTHYKYQGVTFDPADLWDPTETKGMDPPKIDNAIKGTKIRDLVELVGGMGTGTDIVFVASDGYETTVGYSNIYTNPYVQSHQGDAVLVWYADGQYVPQYADGMRFMFTPDDHVFGQWNMHEALDSNYWHYYWSDGIQYPSAAGTSAKWVTEIKVYSSPESDWQLELDATDVGGLATNISKTYLEQALACQFGSEHKATYTDSKGRVWEGMPLWFFAGFVDDADQHSNNAFNDTLAQSGYRVIVTGTDGYSTVIDSREIIRNSDFIVANSLNGTHIDEADENWPLRLTGANVSGSETVKGVKSIRLLHSLVSPDAVFSADPVSGTVPLTVTFTDQSTGEIASRSYDFGDGSTSTEQNPVHIYSAAGTYQASLTVTNGAGSSTAYTTITVIPPLPVADFIATPSSGYAPLNVQFTDTSSDAATWAWTFGDGSASTEQSPSHTYTTAGTYTAALTVTNAAGTASKEIQIVVTVQPPVTDFTASVTSGTVPLTVKFTDASTGSPTSWAWNFGDGTTSAQRNPSHKFTTAGTYTVTLTTTNAGGSSSKSMTITVTQKAPVARFDQNKYSGKIPLTVKFTDRSTNNPTSYLWRFGDGSTSTEKSPSHTYTQAGIYVIRLTATNSGGSDSATSLVVALPRWWFW